MSKAILTCLLAACLVALAGCKHCCHRPFTAGRPPCNGCDGVVPSRLQPVPAPPPARLPPGQPPIARLDSPAPPGFLEPPPRNGIPPPRNGSPPPPERALPRDEEPPPVPPSPDEGPVTDQPPRVRLGPPGPLRREATRQPLPDTDEPPAVANVPGKPAPKGDEDRDSKDEPKVEEDRTKDGTADLLSLQNALPRVDSGLKPFADDIAWLKKKGYRAVLHLSRPGEDTNEARRDYEKAGLKYLNLEISIKPLDKARFDQFVKFVEDTRNHRLYVWEDSLTEGTLAGGLWYLYFRLEKNESDASARAKATRLGLRFDEKKSPHKEMVIAVQNFLKDHKP